MITNLEPFSRFNLALLRVHTMTGLGPLDTVLLRAFWFVTFYNKPLIKIEIGDCSIK